MAYQLFRLPKAVGLDSAVRALSGAKAYFYETGTTTPQDTYSDSDLTTPHAHPVVADSSGVFPPIYLDPSRQYKLTLNNSADELIYTVDPVNDRHGVSYDRTAAEIAAGNDPVSKQYPPNHILRFIPTSEHDAILAGTSSYNASADAQDWLDSLQPGDEAVLVGVVRAQGLVLRKSDITFKGGGWLKPVSNSATAVLTIGDDSSDTLVRRVRGSIKVGDPVGTFSTWSNVAGISFKQAVESNLGVDVRGLGVGMLLDPAKTAVAYNNFYLGQMIANKVSIRMVPTGTGYTNGNRFFGGRFTINSGTYESGVIYVDIQSPTSNAPNDNIFYSPLFEGAGQVWKCAGQDNHIVLARWEAGATGTAGADFASTFFEYTGTGAVRNSISFAYNQQWFTSPQYIDHGAATRTNDKTFTISGDVAAFFYQGAPVQLTIGGTVYVTTTVSASHSGGTTTIRVADPIVTDNPTAAITGRVKDLGSLNQWSIINLAIPSVTASSYQSYRNLQLSYHRSHLFLSPLSDAYPAVTFGPGGSGSDKVLTTTNFNAGETAWLNADGYLSVTRFGLGGATPAARQSAITAPSGGTTIDAEARTAINAVISVLEKYGLVTPN